MLAMLESKKFILSSVGLVLVGAAVLCGVEADRLLWFGGFVTAIVGSFNVGQGIADAGSKGKTSGTA